MNDPMTTIRPEGDADAAAVRAVHLAAFPGDDEAKLVDLLRANGVLAVSLLAETAGGVVGHVAFSPVTVTTTGGVFQGLGLAPVAVLPEHQRRGIGGALVSEGLQACRRLNAAFVVVLGHPEYYPRFGFRRASDFGLSNEYGADDAFMVAVLQAKSLPPGGGLVKYGPEFGAW